MRSLVLFVVCLGATAAVPVSLNGTVTYPANYYGVDVSQPVSESAMKCLVDANLLYAIVRCYQSLGHPDPACAGTVAAAHAAGMKRVDAYMFPCPKCGNAAGQVQSQLSYFSEHKVNVDTLWLDIEGSQYWTGSYSGNKAFYQELVDEAKKLGLKTGVYSSASQWSAIFGSLSYSHGADLPIWYPHYDGIPELSDFSSFGGWRSPYMKQFTDKGAKCGVSYDINFRAAGPGEL
mmetsp:Transcript_34297/g.80167  ORF Transcript_34297/g.80167 Transcript_34297/m.80167 type:complete len:233 (-) Transcript_34297:31-729(-)